MSKRRRIALVLTILLALLLGVAVYGLGSEAVPETTDYVIDLPTLRALANAANGAGEGGAALPVEIRFENLADSAMPRAFLMAGESFETTSMPRPVFQVRFPDGSFVLIDTAYDRVSHESMPAGGPYDDAAWAHLVSAMEGADQIVVTHEHADHAGGIAKHPRPERIAGRLRLNREQADAPRSVDVVFSKALLDRIEPIDYAEPLAIAPGIVLQRAAGHTPGSQLVFVQLADGREFLFVGDVVWNLDAITKLKYRPRLVTDLLLGEDRAAVLAQIRALRTLYDRGEVRLVVSHDGRTFRDGSMIEGFAE